MTHPGEAADQLARLDALCRERGLRMTIQRRLVLAALLARRDHPTADELLQDVEARIAGVSRTTVYRILDQLVELGLARKVSHPGSAVRFDPVTDRHHHLVCDRCGKMLDFEDERLDALRLPTRRESGFEIRDYSVFFHGLCAECRRTADRKDA